MTTATTQNISLNPNLYFEMALGKILAEAFNSLPESNHSRLRKAIQITQGGGVDFDHVTNVYTVKSDCSGKQYQVQGCECDCRDHQNNREDKTAGGAGWVCKHRLAARIFEVASAEARAKLQRDLDGKGANDALAATNGHGEAPYSWTLKTADSGQFTVRANSEDELLTKVASIRAKLNATAPAHSNGTAKSFCPIHQVEMQERTGKYGKFFSHRDGDGWCNGK